MACGCRTCWGVRLVAWLLAAAGCHTRARWLRRRWARALREE